MNNSSAHPPPPQTLYINPENSTWTMTIRNLDEREAQEFVQYAHKSIPPAALRTLIPDWADLQWREVPRPSEIASNFPRELTAQSGRHTINIIAASTARINEIVTESQRLFK
jgi:hypothetical protein